MPVAGPSAVYLVVRVGGAVNIVDVADPDEITFGRSEDVRVRVDESRVSRRHAVLRRDGASLVLEDLGSRNGTWVNAIKLEGESRKLEGGDIIRVGSAEVALAVLEGGSGPWAEVPDAPSHAAASDLGGIVVAEPAMLEVYRVVRRLARMPTTVLILGETGVGKEVVAERIHRWSSRGSGPFVRLSCAALPATLIESELFGHERGAFTGADQKQIGYFESAEKGTLFLDEVGELPLATQVKLLTVLESRRLRRLGGTRDIAVDFRLIAATNRDIAGEVAAKRFREDLYYRLSAFRLMLPPLRERRVEIALLAELFAREISRAAGAPPPWIDPAASQALAAHPWPGNVRELRNAIEHAVVLADQGRIGVEHLPEYMSDDAASGASSPLESRLANVERQGIIDALEETKGNQSHAARLLGITRSALLHRMKKHNLS